MQFPLACHITFGTYGMRLHGDHRGTLDRRMNQFGEPIIDTCEQWQKMERGMLKFAPRVLTLDQRNTAEIFIPAICVQGNWHHLQSAAAPDHVHVLLVTTADGQAVRKWLKRWLGESLSQLWPLQKGRTWWAECGSVKWVWTQDYLRRATNYIKNQRTHATNRSTVIVHPIEPGCVSPDRGDTPRLCDPTRPTRRNKS